MDKDADLEVVGCSVKKKSGSKGPNCQECELVKNFILMMKYLGKLLAGRTGLSSVK